MVRSKEKQRIAYPVLKLSKFRVDMRTITALPGKRVTEGNSDLKIEEEELRLIKRPRQIQTGMTS